MTRPRPDSQPSPDKPVAERVSEPVPAESLQRIDRVDPDNTSPAREFGGPSGLEPTRYGDWERNGRCTDF